MATLCAIPDSKQGDAAAALDGDCTACLAGTLKSFLGLSASMASTVYVAAFQPDGLSFLLFVACLPVTAGVVTIPFLNQVPYLEASEIEDQHQYMTTGRDHSSCLTSAGG